MNTWFLYSIAALALFGIQRFLYKVSAEEKCNTALTTFSFMGTVALISFFFFISGKWETDSFCLLFCLALINGLTFLTSTISTMEALKHIPTMKAMPLIRLNTAAVVILSVILFKDRLSAFQVAGIIIAIAVIVILARQPSFAAEKEKNAAEGFGFAMLALFSGAVAALSSKYAALYVNKLAFISMSYFLSMIFAITLRNRFQAKSEPHKNRRALLIGFSMGLANFAGFYLLLLALEKGPLSVIMPITGMYFVVVIGLSALIYKEKIESLKVFAICLTIVSIILMGL
ncbi:MAG: DMT family transporter [Syntrophales bacterium]|jgi:drug/metabolite transporter (DMT)-like permease|nr:DMT family transporter [Syntrophales bacterium]MDY0045633.1 DMT family transporter [Syntrophales bacterium]